MNEKNKQEEQLKQITNLMNSLNGITNEPIYLYLVIDKGSCSFVSASVGYDEEGNLTENYIG